MGGFADDIAEGTRFIGRSDGTILDTAAMAIPGPRNSPYGKLDYLLGNVPDNSASKGKGGFFRGVLGFSSHGELGSSLKSHLVNNFENASTQGTRIRVIAPLTGANGRTASVTSVWQINPNGTMELITALPGPK